MASFTGTETALQALWILKSWEGDPKRRRSTLEEEQREVLESILATIADRRADPGRAAACAYLLRHLAQPVHD